MSQQKRVIWAVLAVVLLVAIGVIQGPIDYLRYNPKSNSGLQPENIFKGDKHETSLIFDLSVQFFGAAAIGMREAVASMLWVRADEFFHSGNYEAILPIVRLVTWLDPQQIDVYSTGAWHLDYNFVDQDQRSDRRCIPPAIALLEEGVKNNPEIYDLYFELAWTHYYQKIKNYPKAVEWMERACTKKAVDPNTGRMIARPAFVDRMLAHGYEKMGDYDKAVAQWERLLKIAENDARKSKDSSAYQDVSVTRKNLGMLLLRRAWRNGDMAAYARGIEVLSPLVSQNPIEKNALDAAKRNYAEFKAKGSAPRDTAPPVDANFSVTWKKVKPKVLRIKGTLALVPAEDYKGLASEPYTNWYADNLKLPADRRVKWRDGCRVRILLADADYDYWSLYVPPRFSWEVDKTRTIMLDDCSSRDGTFDITVDMSKDPGMYPFTGDKYRLVVWFNSQEAPDFVQDRIGWQGEGLIGKHITEMKTNPGAKILRKEFILRKRDIM